MLLYPKIIETNHFRTELQIQSFGTRLLYQGKPQQRLHRPYYLKRNININDFNSFGHRENRITQRSNVRDISSDIALTAAKY